MALTAAVVALMTAAMVPVRPILIAMAMVTVMFASMKTVVETTAKKVSVEEVIVRSFDRYSKVECVDDQHDLFVS